MPWSPGQRVRIGMAEWAPFVTSCGVSEPALAKSLTCPKPGLSSENLAYLLAQQGIDYELVSYPNPDWGTLIHGNVSCAWSGILGDVYNGTIHTVAVEYHIIPERANCFAFAHASEFTREALVFKRSLDMGRNIYALFRVFTPIIWLVVLFTTLLLGVVLALNNKFFATYFERRKTYREHLFFNKFKVAWTSRWILCLLGLFAIFFLRLYEGSLLASLFIPPTSIPFTNLKELAAAVQYGSAQYLLEEGGSLKAELLNPNSTYFPPRLKAGLLARPVLSASSIDEALEMVRTARAGSLGFSATYSTVRSQIAASCDLDSRFLSELPVAFNGFIFARGEKRLVKLVSDAVHASFEHSEFLHRRYYGGGERPAECRFNGATLGLPNLLGAFVVFGVLATVGLVAFGCELLRCQPWLWEWSHSSANAPTEKTNAAPISMESA